MLSFPPPVTQFFGLMTGFLGSLKNIGATISKRNDANLTHVLLSSDASFENSNTLILEATMNYLYLEDLMSHYSVIIKQSELRPLI